MDVADTGPGIPEDVGDRILEPFFRVKKTKTQHRRASSGLGLALTRRLVEAHGGEIGFSPRPGGGTIFTFTLPTTGTLVARPEPKPRRKRSGARV